MTIKIGDNQNINKNEIRLKASGRTFGYIDYALKLFDEDIERVILKSTGAAINTAVRAAEIIKRRVSGLH